jgi:DNA-binding XRE family transcriptional regulator
MQAVVKTPHIEINIKGNISKQLLTLLKKEYGKKLRFTGQEDNELMNVFETDWYKKVKSETSPGDNMKIYREIHGMTQEALGRILGNIPRQHISNMERGIRAISVNTAKKLSKIFKVPLEKFIHFGFNTPRLAAHPVIPAKAGIQKKSKLDAGSSPA